MGAQSTATSEPRTHLPGEPGVWAFVFGDLAIFSLFFGTYLYYRADTPLEYDAAQRELSLTLGTLNTIILLTSSWLVARAVKHARAGRFEHTKRALGAAITLGLAFCGIKIVEYQDKIASGIGLGTHDFFMFFFMLTGIHLVHVIIGLAILLLAFVQTRRTSEQAATNVLFLECSATFWHLVDILWIVLFSLLYLLRG